MTPFLHLHFREGGGGETKGRGWPIWLARSLLLPLEPLLPLPPPPKVDEEEEEKEDGARQRRRRRRRSVLFLLRHWLFYRTHFQTRKWTSLARPILPFA